MNAKRAIPHEAPGSRVYRVQVRLLRAPVLAVIACGLWLGSGGVLAEGEEPVARVQHAVTEIEPPRDRRLELKRALVGVSELPSAADGRRRLTAEEREALTRELREAMDGVYETRRRERQRSQ